MRLEQWLQGTLRAAIFLTTCGNLFYSDELIIFPSSKVSKVSFSLIFLASRTLLMCVFARIYGICTCSARRKTLDLLELELEMIVSCHMGTEN